MGYKAEGKVEKIFDTEQKSATFQAREFVIQVEDGQYPQMVKFQLVQDKCSLIDDYSEGDQSSAAAQSSSAPAVSSSASSDFDDDIPF